MKDDNEKNKIIRTVKELINNKKLGELIDKHLIPQEVEKKNHAEVSTPFKLRQEMLDKVPIEFWTSIQKVFEPCAGKGGFIVDIIDRFMIGLKDVIPNKKERYKIIVEECLYFSDINPTNVFICKLLIDPDNKYKLNYYEGDTLQLDIQKYFKINKFNAVIGNPPYQTPSGARFWDKFVLKSLHNWLNKKGYLVFIHPQGWRQINNKIGKLMISKQILYLNMNNVNEGRKVFRCSTTYDYYVLQNTDTFKKTLINDYKNKEYTYNLKNVKFIPNHSIPDIEKYLDYDNTDGLILDRSIYETRKKWISKLKTEEFKYPCIYTINKQNELSLFYSNTNNKGHFDQTKFIISNGAGYYKDIEGKYGCTEWAYYIKCTKNDMNKIEKCFQNTTFLNIIDAVKLTSNRYNHCILKHLKKEFWNEFV